MDQTLRVLFLPQLVRLAENLIEIIGASILILVYRITRITNITKLNALYFVTTVMSGETNQYQEN